MKAAPFFFFFLPSFSLLPDNLIQIFPNSSVVRDLEKSFCFSFLLFIILKKTIVFLSKMKIYNLLSVPSKPVPCLCWPLIFFFFLLHCLWQVLELLWHLSVSSSEQQAKIMIYFMKCANDFKWNHRLIFIW